MPQAVQYPKTLVLSPFVFNFQNGSGVTFSNLFQNWPADRLANLHSSPQAADYSVCKNFYRLTDADIHRPWPFKNKSGGSSLGAAPSESRVEIDWSLWRKYVVGNSGLPQYFEPSQALLDWLDAFQPELIYTILGSIPHMEAIEFIQKRYNCKVIVHFMDDWYHQAYTTGIFRNQRKKMLRLFHNIVEGAQAHLAIGDEMARVFSERYGKPMRAFQNAISVSKFQEEINAASSEQKQATPYLLYFGSVYDFAQLDTLLIVARAVEKLKDKNNLALAKLRIVTSQECMELCKKAFSDFAGVELVLIQKENTQFARELANAAALVLPANFNAHSEEFLRYSMPTKLPGYLASGVPILVCGPASIAQVLYAKKAAWGYCVSSENEGEYVDAIRLLLSKDNAIVEALKKNALKAVIENHEVTRVRKEFQDILLQTCNL